MAATSPSVPQLFTELQRLGKEGNFSKAQKIANKILQENPKDADAFHCKVVCLVQQSCFREALDVVNSGSKKGIKELPFEKAYCLYRLNKTSEALEVLKDIPDQGQREKELTAQVYYRLGEYEKCRSIYKDLIKNSEDDYGDERETNLSAVIAASNQWGKTKLFSESGLREDTYELCYNAACLSLANNDYQTARSKLTQAEALCRKSLEEDP
ncbi:signal recognition particle subunit SRP72, partial [Exaiptasia diaphana]